MTAFASTISGDDYPRTLGRKLRRQLVARRGDVRAVPFRSRLGERHLARVLRRLQDAGTSGTSGTSGTRSAARWLGCSRGGTCHRSGSGSCCSACECRRARCCRARRTGDAVWCRCRGRGRRAHPWCRGGHRGQHGAQLVGAHGHQLPQRPGQVAGGEPLGDQRLSQPYRAGQGQLHAPHRVRHRARHRRCSAQHEQHVRHRHRRQAAPGAQRAHQHGPGGRCQQGRRQPHVGGARAARGRRARLRRVPRGVRRSHPQGEEQQAGRQRLPGRHHLAHQPGHHRHRAERAAPDARPRCHRRCRQHRLPGRVPGRRPEHARLAGRQQGRHHHQHLRPSHRAGRRERHLPQARSRAAAGRAPVLRRRVPQPRCAVRSGAVARRPEPGEQRRRDAAQADAGGHAHPRAPGAWSSHRRSRPVALEAAAHAARARPCHLWPHHLGSRSRVPHRWRGWHRQAEAGRPAARAARRVLPHHRRRVHAHPGLRRATLDPGQARRCSVRAVEGTQAARGRTTQRRRGVREVPGHQVRGYQALRSGGCGERHPGARPDAHHGGRRRSRFGGAGHGPPRSAQRARQRHRQELRPDLQGVRGPRRPQLGAGLRCRCSSTAMPPSPGRASWPSASP